MVEPTVSTKEVLLVIHIIGTVLGVGGATISDIIFFKATKDKIMDRHEWGILRSVSLVIWGGLIIAVLSGIGFLLQMDDISNPKIWAKVTIIGVIFLNGVFLHFKIFPLFRDMLDKKIKNTQFQQNMTSVFTSGAISITSWYIVLIMGTWRGLNNTLSYWQMLFAYCVILMVAVAVANVVGRAHIKTMYKTSKQDKSKNKK